MSRVDTGCHQTWGEVWASLPPDHRLMVESGVPTSLPKLWHRGYAEDLLALLAEVGLRPADVASVELGSGRATTSSYLALAGAKATLVDLSPAGLAQAASNFAALGLDAPNPVLADVRATGLPAASFHVVVSIGVIEHFEDPAPFLAESARLLAPGGVAFHVIVPRLSRGRGLPVQALLNPYRAARTVGSGLWRRVTGRSPTRGEMVRTDKRPEDAWVADARAAGAKDPQCIPYNPYFPVYTDRDREARVTVPLYWAHLSRQRRQRALALACPSPLAACQLLTHRG